MHTLFVREHNYWAERIAKELSGDGPRRRGGRRGSVPESDALTGEQIYQIARAIVAAEMQVITYREFLPVLLGPKGLRPYEGYRPDVDASIANALGVGPNRTAGHGKATTNPEGPKHTGVEPRERSARTDDVGCGSDEVTTIDDEHAVVGPSSPRT